MIARDVICILQPATDGGAAAWFRGGGGRGIDSEWWGMIVKVSVVGEVKDE